jgi:hypothetical protein
MTTSIRRSVDAKAAGIPVAGSRKRTALATKLTRVNVHTARVILAVWGSGVRVPSAPPEKKAAELQECAQRPLSLRLVLLETGAKLEDPFWRREIGSGFRSSLAGSIAVTPMPRPPEGTGAHCRACPMAGRWTCRSCHPGLRRRTLHPRIKSACRRRAVHSRSVPFLVA